MVTTLASRFGQLKELPADWRTGRIADHAIIKTGSRNTQDRIDDGKYPFFVRSQIVERINDFSFNGEAVLTAGDGVGTGKVFHYINGPFDCHQRVYRITDFSSELDGYYFYLYFSNHFYDRIMSMTAKSSVDSVRMEMIADMQIPLPPLPEQKAIAKALFDIDYLIQSLERLIAKKRDLKQAAMQQLLTGQTRLPGFSGEWAATRLGDLGVFKGGSGFPKRFQGNAVGQYPFFKVSDMNLEGNEHFMSYANNYVDEAARQKLGATAFPIGTVVFAKVGAALFLERKKSLVVTGCLDNNMMGFIGSGALLNALYTYFVFLSLRLSDFAATTALPSLNSRDLSSIALQVPSLTEQAAIAEVLSDMDAEIAALEARLAKTRNLKQGMTQELLTGRTRLV